MAETSKPADLGNYQPWGEIWPVLRDKILKGFVSARQKPIVLQYWRFPGGDKCGFEPRNVPERPAGLQDWRFGGFS